MRDLANPNTTQTPVEITPAEVATIAKTGCSTCHGAGCFTYGVKAERGALVAPARLSLCRCVQKQFAGRIDIREINGRLCWLPAKANAADLQINLGRAS